MNRIICLCCLATLLAAAVWGAPLDGAANVAALERMSRTARTELLPQDILAKTQAQAVGDSADVALVAMLLLAHTEDAESAQVLQRAAADAEHPLLSGAAIYAQCVRGTRLLRDDDAESSLTFALGRATNPYARLFLAARLHNDFGETAMTALLADAREERDPVVQAFLLQYLAESNDRMILRDVATLPWPAFVEIPENLIVIMHAFTPAANPIDQTGPCANLLQQVNGKLDSTYAKYLLDNWTNDWWNRQAVT